MIGIPVAENDKKWASSSKVNEFKDLAEFSAYKKAFPNPSEFYHPHEIAADALAFWITGNADGGDTKHPLHAKIAAWAQARLQ